MAAETITIDIVINSRNNTSAGMNGAKQTVDRFTQSTQKAKKELDKLGGTNATPKVSVVDRASATLSKIDNGLSKLGRMTIKAPVKILDYATRPLRMIKNALFSIKGLVMAIGAGWAANKLFSQPISTADAYSSAKIGFSTLLGDAAGQDMMNKLDAFAKATPFKTSGVINNANKMLAMGWNPEDIIKDMKIIGDAAASTGKMDQGLESIVRALAQIKTKGKLSSEELNQLSEAGIAAKAMLAEQLGYGTGDAGIAKMSADLEKGLIGSEVAVQALLEGMKKFDGTMERTANETVEGLKSQLEDTFEINVLRRWGQGLQDGAKRGFGSVLELLDKSEGTLKKFGDTVYEIGKELSNWAADKLENTIDKILEITNREDFKNASIFGKAKILWDEIIAEPFSKWWNTKGKPYMIEKANSIGETLGTGISNALIGISNAILDFLGVEKVDGQSKSIGGAFADGFLKGFKGKEVWDAIIKAAGAAFKSGFKAIFSNGWLGTYVSTVLAVKVASGIAKGVQLWYGAGAPAGSFGTSGLGYSGGIKGFLGGASTMSGSLEGSGLIGGLAKLGSLAGSGAQTAGGLTLAGTGTALGIAGGVAGLGNSIVDLTRTIKADTKNDTKLYGTRSATKAGMVGAGALAGAAIGSVVPVVGTGVGAAIGAGLGGIATFLAGNKLADAISGVTKSTAELNEEAEELASKRMAERFGDITLSAEQLQARVREIFGPVQRDRLARFKQGMEDLKTVSDSVLNYKSEISYTHERIMGKETLSESDVAAYKEALQGYTEAVKKLSYTNKVATTNAFRVLFGDDSKGLANATKTMNSAYTKLEKDLSEKSTELNKVISDAFNDGKIDIDEEKKINEIIEQIEKIQGAIEKRMQLTAEKESAATYDLMKKKYGDTNLTPESFKDLMREVNAQSKLDQQTYDDAYIKAKAELDVELELGEIDKKEYNKRLEEIEKKLSEGKELTVKKAVNVSLGVLKTNYSKEFDGIENKLNSNVLFSNDNLFDLSQSTKNYTVGRASGKSGYTIKWTSKSEKEFKAMKDSWLESAGIDLAAQKEMQEFYESLKPQEEDLLELKASYEKAGKEIPKWIEDSLADIANIKIMAGDMDSFYKIVGEQLAKDDPAYAKALKDAYDKGEKIPEALIDGVNEGLKDEPVEVSADVKVDGKVETKKLDDETEKALNTLEEKGYFEVDKSGQVNISAKGFNFHNLDRDTQVALRKLEEEGIVEISKNGVVTVKANVNTDSAKEKTESETKGALGQDQTVNKTAIVPVDSVTIGEGAAADKSKGEVKSALDQRFGTSISENGKVQITGVSISGAGEAISNAWSTFKTWVKEKFSIGVSVTSSVRVNQRMGTTDHSGGDGKKANGGYVDKAIRTIVGEAGPEMIIPLSANRRQRGKYLWERAGRAMGLFGSSGDDKVIMNANGGLYGLGASRLGDMMNGATSGHGTEESPRSSGSRSINVEVGGIQIHVSGGNGAKEDIMNNMDAISEQIALAIESAFQNMPLAVE